MGAYYEVEGGLHLRGGAYNQKFIGKWAYNWVGRVVMVAISEGGGAD